MTGGGLGLRSASERHAESVPAPARKRGDAASGRPGRPQSKEQGQRAQPDQRSAARQRRAADPCPPATSGVPSGRRAATSSRSVGQSRCDSVQHPESPRQLGPTPRRGSSGNKPRRSLPAPRKAVIALICLLVLPVGLLGIDCVYGWGHIHSGVSVGGISVGGMSREDAAALLNQQLGERVSAAPVDLYSTAENLAASQMGSAPTTPFELDSGMAAADDSGDDPKKASSWRVQASTLAISVDGAALAEQAYAVGRGGDFLSGRLMAWTGGIQLPATLNFDSSQLAGLDQILNGALGKPLKNADIKFSKGNFQVVSSAPGIGVDQELFQQQLEQAFLGEPRALVVPMTELPVVINDDQAQRLADSCQQAIAQPVNLVYENGNDWSLTSATLGSWIATRIEDADAQPRLAAYVSPTKLAKGISSILGDRDPGVAPVNARFALKGDGITVLPSKQGTGIDYKKVSSDLHNVLFGSAAAADPTTPTADSSGDADPSVANADNPSETGMKTAVSRASRTVALGITVLEPERSTEDIEAMHITQRISSFSTVYGWSTAERGNNVRVAAGLASNSLVAPGDTWSFNDTVGDPTIARGFRVSKVVSGGTYVDAVGGGICQVSTTIYNAVFDAGYPIVSRANHALYQWQYPAGRDATVYYPWLDFKWQNDTDNWILVMMSYTDNAVTATLWGTDPGYDVKSETGAWQAGAKFQTKTENNPSLEVGKEVVKQQGQNGKKISVTRKVYDSQGKLLRDTTFNSSYDPVDQIIEVGTKPAPAPPPPDNTTNDAASATATNTTASAGAASPTATGASATTGTATTGGSGASRPAGSSGGTSTTTD